MATVKKGTAKLKVQVKEGRIGYYNNVRWRSGQCFVLNNENDFSKHWMVWVEDERRREDRPMSGKQALDKAVLAIRGGESTEGITTDSGSASEMRGGPATPASGSSGDQEVI